MKTSRLVVALAALGCQATHAVAPSQSSPATAPAPSFHYASTPPPPADFRDPERQNKIAALIPRLVARIDGYFKAQAPPSVSVVFVVDGKAALVRTLGVADRRTGRPATPATLYRIGSITKTFTATLIIALRDLGRLRVDDPAELYLPELAQITYPFPDSSRITLRHLLTHTSGLPRDADYALMPLRAVTEAEVLSGVSRARLDSAPGTTFVYSNFGMSLVGLIAGRRAPEGTLRAAMTARVLAPLGMTRTTFDPSTMPGADFATGYAQKAKPEPAAPWQLGASEADGGMWSSGEDMGRWIAYQLQAWPPRSAPESGPLRRASLRELQTPTFSVNLEAHSGAERAEASTTGIGFAWHVRQTCEYERLVEHNGAIDGFSSYAAFAPDRGFGFVILANALDAHVNELMEVLLREAAPVLEPRRLQQPAPEVVDLFRELGTFSTACSEKGYQTLFAELFRQQAPFAEYAPICAQFAARHGACRYGGTRRLATPLSGDFTLTCDRGSILASAQIFDQGGRPRFGGLLVNSTGFAVKPEVARAAEEVLRLYESWDETRAQSLFADAGTRDSIRRSFESARPNLGACRLAPDSATALVGDGANGATFPVRCERGDPPELALEVDEKGRIKNIFLPPPPPSPFPRRCR